MGGAAAATIVTAIATTITLHYVKLRVPSGSLSIKGQHTHHHIAPQWSL